jgi:hypothetical protein
MRSDCGIKNGKALNAPENLFDAAEAKDKHQRTTIGRI